MVWLFYVPCLRRLWQKTNPFWGEPNWGHSFFIPIVGLYYLHLWAGNTLVGWLGGLLDKMPASQFWLIHAGLVATAGVVFVVIRLIFGRFLHVAPERADFVAADAGETP